MLDGTTLRQTWTSAFDEAQSNFRTLLTGGNSGWRRVRVPSSEAGNTPHRARGFEDPVVHKKGDIYRVVVDVPLTTDDESSLTSVENWRAVLVTPETRNEWDTSVEESVVLEMFDPETRIVKTKYTLGWPANPRDAITISRTFSDATTIIDISTSLPRAQEVPSYLRPRPPYVRSHVSLMAWCIQFPQQPSPTLSPPSPVSRSGSGTPKRRAVGLSQRIRVTLFIAHDFHLSWPLSSSASPPGVRLSALVTSLVNAVRSKGHRVPVLSGYGLGVDVERLQWDVGREVLGIEYTVHEQGDDATNGDRAGEVKTLEDVQQRKERRRLERKMECRLPQNVGWDIRVSARQFPPASSSSSGSQSSSSSNEPWSVQIAHISPTPSSPPSASTHLILTLTHPTLYQPTYGIRQAQSQGDPTLKVTLLVEVVAPHLGVRVNGHPHPVGAFSVLDPLFPARSHNKGLVGDVDVRSLNFTTDSDVSSTVSSSSLGPGTIGNDNTAGSTEERSPAAKKAILTRVKRNYIYFTSLLQEPEVKWKRYSEAKGVTISTLSSIDPTLLIYRAEAVFVGVSMWEMYAGVTTYGIRSSWDKSLEDAGLLEDLGSVSLSGVSELWLERAKGSWNINPRESILLRTVYKSPTTIHVFAFSTDDGTLFPSIPLLSSSNSANITSSTSSSSTSSSGNTTYIRSQVDLQGFAIEALSPTTTALTLLSQGSTAPAQLGSFVSGVGEWVIRNGAPPLLSALRGAKLRRGSARYDPEKGVLKIEYESLPTIADADTSSDVFGSVQTETVSVSRGALECEVRCDVDNWASSVELVIDPPPASVRALRRHRLSETGGLWITISHPSPTPGLDVGKGRVLLMVKKSKERERGIVVVNGGRIDVDVEELDDREVARLGKQKRVKPGRVPLDQPPTPIRRRKTEWESDDDFDSDRTALGTRPKGTPSVNASRSTTTVGFMPSVSSPLSRMWTTTIESTKNATRQAVTAVSPPTPSQPLTAAKRPTQHALDALAYLQAYHSRAHFDGWALANPKEKEGDKRTFLIHRKTQVQVSPALPVYKGERVLEGVVAEDVAGFVASFECRKLWDDRFDGGIVFEEYGGGVSSGFVCMKSVFPFRDRGFYVCCASARSVKSRGSGGVSGDRHRERNRSLPNGRTTSGGGGYGTTIFYAMASFHPNHASAYASAKYNPYTLPIGRVFLDGWIFETLDPYTTTEHYTIPSTRCTRLLAIDFAGSIPAAYNSMINIALPRTILSLETYLRGVRPGPIIRIPAVGVYLDDGNDDADHSERSSDDTEEQWILNDRDEERNLVSSERSSSTRVFRAYILIQPQFKKVPSTPQATSRQPRTSLVSLASPSQVTASGSEPSVSRTPTRPSRADTMPSSPSSSADTIRHRRVSSTSSSAMSPPRSMPGDVILSSASSASTSSGLYRTKEEDFLIAELVIDSMLYAEGYDITLRSLVTDNTKDSDSSSLHPVLLPPSNSGQSASPSHVLTTTVLPISSALYTLPSTPLYNSDNRLHARHLLRLTLPTAQFYAPSIADPLTDEVRNAPEKPEWLIKLEEHGGDVEIIVKPREEMTRNTSKMSVRVDGIEKGVLDEKESLSALGRSVLEGEKERRSYLTRTSTRREGEDPLPKSLMTPVAIAYHLHDRHVGKVGATSSSHVQATGETEKKREQPTEIKDSAGNVATEEEPRSSQAVQRAPTGASSFMDFFHSYSKPFLRLSTQANLSLQTTDTNGKQGRSLALPPAGQSDSSKTIAEGTEDETRNGVGYASDGLISTASRSRGQRMYPLATVVIVAVISFLLGSLLRSLLSPAEFVAHFPSESNGHNEHEHIPGRPEYGWREIKRLVEIKYLMGGWDFVVAVVRRH